MKISNVKIKKSNDTKKYFEIKVGENLVDKNFLYMNSVTRCEGGVIV